MTEQTKAAILQAVKTAIAEYGASEFRKTSMFMSSHQREGGK